MPVPATVTFTLTLVGDNERERRTINRDVLDV